MLLRQSLGRGPKDPISIIVAIEFDDGPDDSNAGVRQCENNWSVPHRDEQTERDADKAVYEHADIHQALQFRVPKTCPNCNASLLRMNCRTHIRSGNQRPPKQLDTRAIGSIECLQYGCRGLQQYRQWRRCRSKRRPPCQFSGRGVRQLLQVAQSNLSSGRWSVVACRYWNAPREPMALPQASRRTLNSTANSYWRTFGTECPGKISQPEPGGKNRPRT